MDVSPKATGDRTGGDRRKSARHKLTTAIAGVLLPSHAKARLLDVSESGFALQTTLPLERGADVEFQVAMTGLQPAVTLRGRVVHTMRTSEQDGFSYVVGVQAR